MYFFINVFHYAFCCVQCIFTKVAVIGLNHATPDGFSFVATEDLPNGEVIYFTENEYSASGNAFADQGERVVKFTATSAISKGSVFFIKETGVSTDVFNFISSSGSGTAVKTTGSGSFSLATDGETYYAYSDGDENPTNGVTKIYSALIGNDPKGKGRFYLHTLFVFILL